MTAKHANKTDCYVCGQIPHSAVFSTPMMSVPISSSYRSEITESGATSKINGLLSRPTHTMNYQPINMVLSLGLYPWCVKCNGTVPVGETLNCTKITNYLDYPELNHTSVGVYWVCGNSVYPLLPNAWSIICALGHLAQAMRLTHTCTLPSHIRYRRSTDVFGTHHQSFWTRTLQKVRSFQHMG